MKLVVSRLKKVIREVLSSQDQVRKDNRVKKSDDGYLSHYALTIFCYTTRDGKSTYSIESGTINGSSKGNGYATQKPKDVLVHVNDQLKLMHKINLGDPNI